MFDTDSLIALIMELKRTDRTLQEHEALLHIAACDYLTRELRENERVDNNT